MANVKLKLTKEDGSEYGYVGLDGKKFIGGVSASNAIVFIRKPYKKELDVFYYEVSTKKGYFMDQHSKDGDIFLNSPNFSVEASTIWAWKNTDNHQLHAFAGDKDSKQIMGLPHSSSQEKMTPKNSLFSNFNGYPLKVEIIAQ